MFYNPYHSVLLLFGTLVGLLTIGVAGLGSSCSAPLGAGTASPGAPFWLEQIKHQGTSAYNSNPGGYQVFRNVKVGVLYAWSHATKY